MTLKVFSNLNYSMILLYWSSAAVGQSTGEIKKLNFVLKAKKTMKNRKKPMSSAWSEWFTALMKGAAAQEEEEMKCHHLPGSLRHTHLLLKWFSLPVSHKKKFHEQLKQSKGSRKEPISNSWAELLKRSMNNSHPTRQGLPIRDLLGTPDSPL